MASLWRALLCAALLAVCVSALPPPVLLLKGGTVVNADRAFTADVLLRNGLIEAVGPGLTAPQGARVVDATGKLVFPGGIETHTHLSFPDGGAAWGGPPTCDDAFSGHGAAAAGGTTMARTLTVAFDTLHTP
jgi:dihydroorotase-like cyclic amidohydrolase